MPSDETAAGAIEVVNAAMEGAVRVALRKRGDDPRDHALVAFGGAGPLHAAELARRLSIATVIVPPHPGTLSALGLLTADVRLDFAASELHRSDEESLAAALVAVFAALMDRAQAEIDADGALRTRRCSYGQSCDIRYLGQAYEVTVPVDLDRIATGDTADIFDDFHAMHERAYGFSSPAEECEIVTMRLVVTVAVDKPSLEERAPASMADPVAPTRPSCLHAGLGVGRHSHL